MQHNLYKNYTKPKNCSRAYDLILICPKRFAWNSQRVTRKVRRQLTSIWRQKSVSKVLADIKELFYDFMPATSVSNVDSVKLVFASSTKKLRKTFSHCILSVSSKMTWKMKIFNANSEILDFNHDNAAKSVQTLLIELFLKEKFFCWKSKILKSFARHSLNILKTM